MRSPNIETNIPKDNIAGLHVVFLRNSNAMAAILRKSSNKSAYSVLLKGVSIASASHCLPLNENGNGRVRHLSSTRRCFDLHTTSLESSSLFDSSSRTLKHSLKGFGGSVRNVASASATLGDNSVVLKSKGLVESIQHHGQCFWELSKARLSMLVVATSGAGFVLGSGASVDWATLSWTCAGTMMVAASANSFNQIFEVSNDAKMKRTMRRPLPCGRLSIPSAVTWAMCMGFTGSVLLALKANVLAAGLATSNIAFYALIYTPLKQIHPINTWVGAIVGAIPPLIGWAAATGQVTLEGLVLPAVLYFWQIPHFMALAYLCRNDYAAGGFKMLSLLDSTGVKTSLVALRNCFYLLPAGFVAYHWNITSAWFGLETALLTLGMGAAALLFYFNRNTKNAWRLFHASILYLPLLMIGMLFHRFPHTQLDGATTNLGESDNMAFENAELVDSERSKGRNVWRRYARDSSSRPPVAYASAAPFPFLPVPVFSSAD